MMERPTIEGMPSYPEGSGALTPFVRIGRLSKSGVYVYRCCGKIDEIVPATGIHLAGDKLIVLLGEEPVAIYDRGDVYFASAEVIAPPMLT